MSISWQLSQPDATRGSTVKAPNPALPATEWKLDPATWDLALPLQLIRGGEAVAQRIKVRFKFFLGEWFLDQRQGVPFYQMVFVKRPDMTAISNMFRQVLVTTSGVQSISFFQLDLDKKARALTATFEVKLTDGSTVTFKNEPFIVGNQ